jgi:hypothetical protein
MHYPKTEISKVMNRSNSPAPAPAPFPVPLLTVAPTMSSEPLYSAYLPTRTDGYIAPIAVPAFDADEPGLRADPAKASLLKGATVENITPRIGTEIRGVQISSLGKEGLDELALLAAERGVVVFVSPLLCLFYCNFVSVYVLLLIDEYIARPGFCRCRV